MRNAVLAGCAAVALLLIALATRVARTPTADAKDALGGADLPRTLLSSVPPQGGDSVRARAVGPIPGALICADFRTVAGLLQLYTQAYQEQAEDQQTGGQSRLLRGPAATLPNVRAHGCVVARDGTALLLERGNVVPVVSMRVGRGWARGVTLPEMLTAPVLTAEAKSPLNPEAARAGSVPVAKTSDSPPPAPATTNHYAAPSSWAPASESAETTTGNVTFSNSRVTLAGQGYAMIPHHVLPPAELAEADKLFRYVGTPQDEGFWFRIAIPDTAPMLGDRHLCAGKAAAWLLALISADHRDLLQLAFFSSRQNPDLAPPPIDDETHLCGTFSYVPDAESDSPVPTR